jgi:hypothetical protein
VLHEQDEQHQHPGPGDDAGHVEGLLLHEQLVADPDGGADELGDEHDAGARGRG